MSTDATIRTRLTPVPRPAQEAARALLRDGHRTQAVVRLRKGTDLGLRQAAAAADLLAEDVRLPASHQEAIDVLEELLPDVHREVAAMARGGDEVRATRLLRQETGVGLVIGYQLVSALNERDRSA
ncbi:hypothetical protein [Streptomyces clavuligerus]|uniref:Uncharacterized protein n=1 Tax=Streptomyces clavuligerus TaxID=1901 RepID=D5SLA9_STRCL|nr:hypothetical protein [Streptomyces clavuligerus]ANW22572.1 hypothetical protein BB341_30150 [Streptomyces clavuligerus]AXU17457.1 hypothetical protein D1794_33305 [Streptomyces clavuligerus]EFG04702.1 Hypothetical protein SCLAV_p1216 [Streptomyces clavuligerus]MBY6306851.1 hypothetical protein [Streptomyces clavuligerus]QCS10553.1 hypothetical protein CRV15_34020 [Streptomyces clavuligerus]